MTDREFKFEVQLYEKRVGWARCESIVPLDRQVKVAQNDLHTPHPSRTVPD